MTKRTTTSRRRGKGSITSYATKAGTRWRFQVWVPADPEHPEAEWKHVGKGGFETADAADDAMQDARTQHKAGVDLTATIPTVAEYAERWLRSLDLAAATMAQYRRNVTKHIVPHIGGLRLDRVTPTRIGKLYVDLQRPDASRARAAGGLSKNTVLKVATNLSQMFDAAVEDRYIATNPTKRKAAKAPTATAVKREQAEMVTWSPAQLSAFLTWDRDTFGDDMHALWFVAAHTGMRRSELLGLRWSDVDLTAGRIQVRRALDTARPGEVKGTKSNRARVVDIDPGTVTVLRRWRRERGGITLELTKADAFVFGTATGAARCPVSTSEMFARRITRARAALGADALPTMKLHGLRHTHATILLEAGENPKVVSERLGHASVSFTLTVYAHVTPTMQRGAVDRFTAALSGAANGTS
ncbi:tyrosine-type recombinase/integrase [Tsukamurella paurometabola]|uniref:Site-specific integrase n=1 Tax=Tsukamurella paurometabola TaxID=2061 RepID=A0ABS5NJU8_TSUPA|nr:site-specific integrase [Tsukamurella paurometabola]MBS4103882.1 site-specific integrase [Tsukamurella paurometabola]